MALRVAFELPDGDPEIGARTPPPDPPEVPPGVPGGAPPPPWLPPVGPLPGGMYLSTTPRELSAAADTAPTMAKTPQTLRITAKARIHFRFRRFNARSCPALVRSILNLVNRGRCITIDSVPAYVVDFNPQPTRHPASGRGAATQAGDGGPASHPAGRGSGGASARLRDRGRGSHLPGVPRRWLRPPGSPGGGTRGLVAGRNRPGPWDSSPCPDGAQGTARACRDRPAGVLDADRHALDGKPPANLRGGRQDPRLCRPRGPRLAVALAANISHCRRRPGGSRRRGPAGRSGQPPLARGFPRPGGHQNLRRRPTRIPAPILERHRLLVRDGHWPDPLDLGARAAPRNPGPRPGEHAGARPDPVPHLLAWLRGRRGD